MKSLWFSSGISLLVLLHAALIPAVKAEDPYQFITWNVAYQTAKILGVSQQVIGINGQFPGPPLDSVTNNNLVINVFNQLDEPLLISWNGISQRKTSWQDGVSGTNCPILPGSNWTYEFQLKDQIGSYFYFPSLLYQKADGGFGAIRIANRDIIPVPFPTPDGDINFLVGDWYNTRHQDLRRKLDSGLPLGSPDGVLINGKGSFGQGDYSSVTVDPGKTYRLRVSNVGTVSSINFRIQGHQLLLVETEGSHTNEILLDSLDVHVGQSYSVLVKTNQSPSDFYVVASTKFQPNVLQGVGILHYSDSHAVASGPIPPGPDPNDINFSMNQANTVRRNLTANAARPNPQGSYHYGEINVTRRIQLQNTAVSLNGHQRYAVNGISYLTPDTPLKLADYLNISGVFTLGSIPDFPPQQGTAPVLLSSVFDGDWQAFIEIVFLNTENEVQSWHLDGHDFFVAGYGIGSWSEASRHDYNLLDGVSRSTTHVYPNGWTAILFPGDNAGMWNIRSQTLYRQYLGQEIYIRFYNPTNSFRTEAPAPANLIRCGRAA